MRSQASNWTEVVLTGGPCAGKSTALSFLSQKLSDRGIVPLCVPEVATMIMESGVNISGVARSSHTQFFDIEMAMLRLQQDMRTAYRMMAASYAPRPVVIIYDRAEIDILAYVDRAAAERHTTRYFGMSLEEIAQSYETVIHLVTAAIGAEHAYSSETNPSRYETTEEARVRDRKVLDAWSGHRGLTVIGNTGGFPEKLDQVLNVVLEAVGSGLRREGRQATSAVRRCEVIGQRIAVDQLFSEDTVKVEIDETYLHSASDDVILRLRRRESATGDVRYYLGRTSASSDSGEQNYERLISEREYDTMMLDRDRRCGTLTITRTIDGETAEIELDNITQPDGSTIQLINAPGKESMPKSIRQKVNDVTCDHRFHGRALANLS